jgi:PAS domain S-box-containing protein
MSNIAPSHPVFGGLDACAYSREILAAIPGAAVLAFDRDLRVEFAEGAEFARLGLAIATLVGSRLPDVLPAAWWADMRRHYESALAGRTSTFDFSPGGIHYSFRVSPLVSDGAIVGGLVVSHEVTEQRRLESVAVTHDAVIRESRRLWAPAFDRAPIGMSVVDLDGRWLRVNQSYCRMFGYERDELLGKSFCDLTHPEDLAEDLEWLRSASAGGSGTHEREKRYIARDGSIVWVDVRCEMIRDDHGDPAYVLCLLQNITARRNADLALQASERRLRSILDNTPSAVSVKGPDRRYQMVNRAFEEDFSSLDGGAAGRRDDEVLPPSAVAVERASDDLVLRTGDVIEQEEALPRDGEDRFYLTVKFPVRDDEHQVTAVCAIYTDITERKRREQELQDRVEWTERIHSAIARNRLVLHAQPILDLRSGEISQAELLVRMLAGPGSSAMIPPGDFLPAAERFDLVAAIDLWVVARALEVAAAGHRVEVNLSGKTISDWAHVAEIERMVVDSGAPPENVIFEITETAVAENMESAARFAERLRAVGCSFALDDFGVGFGTFTYLKHLAVDFLKIDIEFVRDLVGNETDRRVVNAIVGVAGDFGMKTIAEGVEDEATLELLRQMGVDYAQGFWIARPGPIAELWPDAQKGRLTPQGSAHE